jgi:hypothetical protein
MSTLEGVLWAKKAGLGREGVEDVILTRYLFSAAELFKGTGHTGRCFTVLRHPIERAVSLFYSLKRDKKKAFSDMSISDYAKSSLAEDNWMVRIITNTMKNKITKAHLDVRRRSSVANVSLASSTRDSENLWNDLRNSFGGSR